MTTQVGRKLCLLALLTCSLLFLATSAFSASIIAPDVLEYPRVEDAYFKGAILIGDSMADGLALHNLIPELQMLSRIGMTPSSAMTDTSFKNDGEAVTVVDKIPVMRPTAVYVWLGANALVGVAPDRVIRDYDRLLTRMAKQVPATTPFYLLEVTPVRALSGERYANFTNERIDTFNTALYDLAKRHGSTYLLPVNSLLKNADGLLDASFAADDGIHLLRPAYEILADYLYTHAIPLE